MGAPLSAVGVPAVAAWATLLLFALACGALPPRDAGSGGARGRAAPPGSWTAAEDAELSALRARLRNASLLFSPAELRGWPPAQTPLRASTAPTTLDGVEAALCAQSDFAGGLHADAEFGTWAAYKGDPPQVRTRLFRETAVRHADLDLFRIVGGNLTVKNCAACTAGHDGGKWMLPLVQLLLDTVAAAGARVPDARLHFLAADGIPDAGPTLPIFAASKVRGSKAILLPDWIHAVTLLDRSRAVNDWVGRAPWESRLPVAVWRGALNAPDFGPAGIVPQQTARIAVLHQGSLRPDLIDASCDPEDLGPLAASFTPEIKEHVVAKYCRNASRLSMPQQADRYRYAVSTDGFGAAFRTLFLLSSGMLPILPRDSAFVQHYTFLLEPGRDHAAPALVHLGRAVEGLRGDDARARRTALGAMRFAARNLGLKATLCYLLQIVRRAAALQEGADWAAIEVEMGQEMRRRGYAELVKGRGPFVGYREWERARKGAGSKRRRAAGIGIETADGY